MSDRVLAAPAKVNLFLHVLAREPSGYHQLETLFQGLELHDRIRIRGRDEPGVTLRLEAEDDLGSPDQNLAVRAARAYRMRAGLDRTPGVEIRLEKRIPAGAGLGGGSSDAAAVLRALDRRHDGALDRDELLEVAAGLGSDVPFFLGERPLALAWGRGVRLLTLPPLPERPVVVAVPDFRISTAEAYHDLDRPEGGGGTGPQRPRVLAANDLDSWESVVRTAGNDFEGTVLEVHPRARELRNVLVTEGAAPALLSGSGSAVFGVFSGEEPAEVAAARIRDCFEGIRVTRTRTLASWPRAAESGPEDGRTGLAGGSST